MWTKDAVIIRSLLLNILILQPASWPSLVVPLLVTRKRNILIKAQGYLDRLIEDKNIHLSIIYNILKDKVILRVSGNNYFSSSINLSLYPWLKPERQFVGDT